MEDLASSADRSHHHVLVVVIGKTKKIRWISFSYWTNILCFTIYSDGWWRGSPQRMNSHQSEYHLIPKIWSFNKELVSCQSLATWPIDLAPPKLARTDFASFLLMLCATRRNGRWQFFDVRCFPDGVWWPYSVSSLRTNGKKVNAVFVGFN